MAAPKQRCPNCDSLAFVSYKTAYTDLGEHELENAKVKWYRCSVCGCTAQLSVPRGTLTVIKKGKITEDLARRVLSALGILEKFPTLPKKFNEH